jgi:hypothetical protein
MAMTDTTTLSTEATPRRLRLPSLRLALAADAAVTAANGAAYLIAAEPIGDLLGLSPSLLRGTGAFLLAFAALVAAAARTPRPRRGLVSAIVAANAVWALDSLIAAAAGWGSPTTAGTAWIAAQGLAVGALWTVQALALRRSRTAP